MKQDILLVDDEEGIRTVLSITLADAGYHVVTAGNGEEALRLFRELKPPIVLTDIKMPGMTGVALLNQIKKERPDTEVIMITGHGDMDLAIESLKNEATDFITKPINDDVLGIALKRANERISMRRQLKDYTENLEMLVQKQSAKLVAAERISTISNTFEGLSSAIWTLTGDLEGDLRYLNEMPCLVSVHNLDRRIAVINQLFLTRIGDRVGESSWGIYKGKLQDPDRCPVGQTFKTGKGQRTRAAITYATGAEVPVIVHTSPIRNSDGEVELVLEISVDITEIRQLQETLHTTRQNYRQLFDEVPCYITLQDRSLKLTEANRRFKDDFDHTPGSHCYQVYKYRSDPCPDCPVQKTFNDGQSHHSEMTVRSKSGDQYHVLIWTAPIYNEEGEITRVMEMSTNITEVRKLQDHLASIGLKIGAISHGIKGLLTGLDGGMYLLDSAFTEENQKQIKEGWEIVKLMVGRIRHMVLDILYFAKERELQWEQVSILDFANDAASAMALKMTHQGIDFACDFDDTTGNFEIDPGVVHSAVVNILENAMDACQEDPSERAHQITFRIRQDTAHIFLEVEDNGIGMDSETLENLFTLFQSSKGSMGTGLGLFISNKIIEQHGGSISVTSRVGEGSCFCIKLPKKPPAGVKP